MSVGMVLSCKTALLQVPGSTKLPQSIPLFEPCQQQSDLVSRLFGVPCHFIYQDPQLFDTFRTALSTSSRAGSRFLGSGSEEPERADGLGMLAPGVLHGRNEIGTAEGHYSAENHMMTYFHPCVRAKSVVRVSKAISRGFGSTIAGSCDHAF